MISSGSLIRLSRGETVSQIQHSGGCHHVVDEVCNDSSREGESETELVGLTTISRKSDLVFNCLSR